MPETFPFTPTHLTQFRKELESAGSFPDLMIQKEALDQNGEETIHNNIIEYKRRFLTGVYKSLRPFYDTEMPYIFWNALYETLLKVEQPVQ